MTFRRLRAALAGRPAPGSLIDHEPVECIVYAEDPSRDVAAFEDWLEGQIGERLYVERSHDRNPVRAREFPEGFLFFRYRIEVDDARRLAPRLLRLLWDNGIPAVASSDYEDELPERGGYKSRAIPWPRALAPFDCTVYAEDRTRTWVQLRDWLERELGQPVDVRQSDERDAERAREFPDGFHCFRYQIEAGPKATVERLLQVLWDDGIPAIAECDYADELSERGGYKSRNIPWPD